MRMPEIIQVPSPALCLEAGIVSVLEIIRDAVGADQSRASGRDKKTPEQIIDGDEMIYDRYGN